MRDLMPGEAPVMTAQSGPVQVASLTVPMVQFKAEPRRMLNLDNLTKEMESPLPVYPQRRVFSPNSAPSPQDSVLAEHTNRVSTPLTAH